MGPGPIRRCAVACSHRPGRCIGFAGGSDTAHVLQQDQSDVGWLRGFGCPWGAPARVSGPSALRFSFAQTQCFPRMPTPSGFGCDAHASRSRPRRRSGLGSHLQHKARAISHGHAESRNNCAAGPIPAESGTMPMLICSARRR
jgi:hypothetical protein